ncbi:Eco57I restriction-modification methylase domain-containing protein [Cyclobacterium sp.]|uniref:Eco57I restriction-modification methylase domain-containing protein n=1 Tax=Cyclobacterium sp. TaxID=1966343 RepID=UPI0019A118CA|nr:Eco57I restriction-modification methylase domain-containing protein [Cyclobacterium sp.]MBD3628745.1 Eco57I restriction-modification methylase domain-containing protein [Cyclobacterium sp.]
MKFTSSLKLKLIYVFRINDQAHEGCLKVGEATSDNENIWGLEPNSKALNRAAKARIDQYTLTAGIAYDLLYTEVSVYAEKGTIKAFSDAEVHNVLLRSGIKRKTFDKKNKANEWFETDLDTVKKAISAVKEGKDSLQSREITISQNPIVFRPEQLDAIERTKKQFKRSSEMLWFAKMRFGKTLSALQVAKEHLFNRTLILTHRPVVDKGWFEDFGKIFYDLPEYTYGSKNQGNTFDILENLFKKGETKYVYFASMQDLRGSELVGGNFDKNDEIFSTIWDFIIVDEAHEGTQTELGKAVLRELKKTNTKILHLSGTPFNLLDNYKEEEIYTWDYVMEQKAKADWDKVHFGDPNPYASLPKLNIFTYDIGKLVVGFIDEEVAFNFREFFRVDKTGGFIHCKDVLSFLNLICKHDVESNYPYSTNEYRDNFRHSLWMVPGVKEAKALSRMLQSHPVFGQFKIVNVAGEGDEEQTKEEALKKVESAITDKPHETYTITLSCGRLTTGVSVKAWTAVFMLSGSHNTAASSYMQTIFRVQTPATINGKVKEECFVFDFAPDRTLKVIAETAKVSAKAGKTSGEDRKLMGEFLNFCPIIAVHGSQMLSYDVNGMLEQLKKVYVERVVRNGFEDGYLYNNDQLMKLESVELEEFDGLKEIIGSTKAMPKSGDIDVNKQGFTDEEYKQLETAKKKKKTELSEEEKQLLAEKSDKKKNRDSAISILRGISIRMPLLIYGADVINEETEISIDNFTELVDDQSWEEFMPEGVDKPTFLKFKKYYEPDVFRAAGKRIRALARAADQLTIEERIERITSIFGTFRNPDKETVLTPWRVVNMHLGDCLGGYVFLDENREKTIDEPRFVLQGEVTENVFSSDAKILEINSKSGLYPLYVTYSIFRKRVAEIYPDKEPNTLTIRQQLELWNKTVVENIFVICKTPMAKAITKRTLIGFRDGKLNMHAFEDIVNQITNKTGNFVKRLKKGNTYRKELNINNMKFNAIVGNPPYQIKGGAGGTSDSSIYHHFVEMGKKIEPKYLSMITPSRWLAGGRGLGDFRQEMLSSNNIIKLIDFPVSREVFPNVEVKGGISYFLWSGDYNDKCEVSVIRGEDKASSFRQLDEFDVFVRHPLAVEILRKVIRADEPSIMEILTADTPFGIATNFDGFHKQKQPGDIALYYVRSGKRDIGFVPRELIRKNKHLIDKWKVFVPKAGSDGGQKIPDSVLGKPWVSIKPSVASQTFLAFFVESEKQAQNVESYYKTNFFRHLVSLRKITQDALRPMYSWVPLQDFSQKSDIDWNKSIPEIDQQLYTKYGLNEEEIAFIERMIKPMTE